MKLEYIILNEMLGKNIIWLCLHEIYRKGKFIETENKVEVTRDWERNFA